VPPESGAVFRRFASLLPKPCRSLRRSRRATAFSSAVWREARFLRLSSGETLRLRSRQARARGQSANLPLTALPSCLRPPPTRGTLSECGIPEVPPSGRRQVALCSAGLGQETRSWPTSCARPRLLRAAPPRRAFGCLGRSAAEETKGAAPVATGRGPFGSAQGELCRSRRRRQGSGGGPEVWAERPASRRPPGGVRAGHPAIW